MDSNLHLDIESASGISNPGYIYSNHQLDSSGIRIDRVGRPSIAKSAQWFLLVGTASRQGPGIRYTWLRHHTHPGPLQSDTRQNPTVLTSSSPPVEL